MDGRVAQGRDEIWYSIVEPIDYSRTDLVGSTIVDGPHDNVGERERDWGGKATDRFCRTSFERSG